MCLFGISAGSLSEDGGDYPECKGDCVFDYDNFAQHICCATPLPPLGLAFHEIAFLGQTAQGISLCEGRLSGLAHAVSRALG